MTWGTLSIQLENDQWWHSAFPKKPHVHRLSTIGLGPLAQNIMASLQSCWGQFQVIYIYIFFFFFYQSFFLGNAENISHISVKVISFRNDTDSQKIYFMTSFLDFLCDPQGELTLWPPPVLPNGEYSHHLRVRQKSWSLWVPSQLKNQISNGCAWLNSLGTQNYFIHFDILG